MPGPAGDEEEEEEEEEEEGQKKDVGGRRRRMSVSVAESSLSPSLLPDADGGSTLY